MTALVIVLLAAMLLVGVAAGFVIGTRQAARMIARMSDAQLDELADRVKRYRDGAG